MEMTKRMKIIQSLLLAACLHASVAQAGCGGKRCTLLVVIGVAWQWCVDSSSQWMEVHLVLSKKQREIYVKATGYIALKFKWQKINF